MFWIGFIAGIFVGALIGVCVMALCNASNYREENFNETED